MGRELKVKQPTSVEKLADCRRGSKLPTGVETSEGDSEKEGQAETLIGRRPGVTRGKKTRALQECSRRRF